MWKIRALNMACWVWLFFVAIVYVKGDCGPPQEFDLATHDAGSASSFPVGTRIVYSCSPGHYNDGGSVSVCRDDGWYGPIDLECYPKSCGDPGTPLNGDRQGDMFEYPNEVMYSCDNGYYLIGSGWAQCGADGLWTTDRPSCSPVQCPQLDGIVDGSFSPPSARTFRTVVTYRCNAGFSIIGDRTRTCQADREWSGQEPQCAVSVCEMPHFQDGTIEGLNGVGDIITFRCFPNTTHSGARTSICKDDETWSTTPPQCWRSCSIYGVDNGEAENIPDTELITHGESLRFKCTVEQLPSLLLSCNNGTWQNAATICDKGVCEASFQLETYHGSSDGCPELHRMEGTSLGECKTEACSIGGTLLMLRDNTCVISQCDDAEQANVGGGDWDIYITDSLPRTGENTPVGLIVVAVVVPLVVLGLGGLFLYLWKRGKLGCIGKKGGHSNSLDKEKQDPSQPDQAIPLANKSKSPEQPNQTTPLAT